MTTRTFDPVTGVDFTCPEPNINSVPLWLLSRPLSREATAAIVAIHKRGRAGLALDAYAEYTLDLPSAPAAHHRLICQYIDDLLDDQFDILIINTPPGSAKALALDTPIATPDGWTTMGNLRVGDEVFDENGRPCEVTWVSPIHRNRPVYAVTTDCGDTIIADRDHEWLVRLCGKPKRTLKGTDRWGNPLVRANVTEDRSPVFRIKETHELHRRRAKRPMIRRALPLHLPPIDLPIDPYLLGVWLGDGTCSTPAITSSDEDRPWLRAELHRLGYETTDRSAPCLFGVKGVRHLFTSLGLLNDPFHNTFGRKHIPARYLRASYHQRLALLQGLIDTDGTVCRHRGCTTFCNTSLELAVQVRELVRSLGVKAGWSESRAVCNGKECGPCYKVSFYLENSARMPRKAILTRNQSRTPDTYIDVVPAGHADTVCIEVNSPSHLFLCGKSMTPTHNSTYTSHALGAYFMGRFPSRNVIIATHTADLAERWSRKVRNTIGDQRHQQVFPDSQLSRDSTAVGRWATTLGGEFLAAGVGASILGFRSDLGLIDDPIGTFEQAQSITQLKRVHDWYETEFLTRLKPGGKQVVICQRLSANDMAGYLLQRNADNPAVRMRVLTLKMVCDNPADDPLGRSFGERLWSEWFTTSMVEDAKRDDFKWRTLYQQSPPSDSGDWVDIATIPFVDPADTPANLNDYLLTDLALSVNSGDYSVHIVAGVSDTHDIYIKHAWRARTSIDDTVNKHLDLAATYPLMESLIDDDNAAKVYVQLLAVRARERGIHVPWKMLPMRGQDKETRAAPLRGMFRRGKIRMVRGEWNRWLLTEINNFPNAMGQGVDDGVDALGLIGRRLASLALPAPAVSNVVPLRQKTWQDTTLDEMFEDAERIRHQQRRI